MEILLVSSLLSACLIKLCLATPAAANYDNWATDEIFSNTYIDFDTMLTTYDDSQGSIWDENLATDPEFYTEFLAGANPGCSGDTESSAKRRREESCLPRTDPRLSLPQSPFDVLEQKNRINLDLEPMRFPAGTPQLTQLDNIYCDNKKFVVCDSAREQDKQLLGNGQYRLLNVKRGMIPFHQVRACQVRQCLGLINPRSPPGIPMH